jgi:hypothetical protein
LAAGELRCRIRTPISRLRFQTADSLAEFAYLAIFAFERRVNSFGPTGHTIRPATPGLKQRAMAIEPNGLTIESVGNLLKASVHFALQALFHVHDEVFKAIHPAFQSAHLPG